MPESFRTFVLKVHSRCDLACDHCYIYESADQSWRDRPLMMSARTAAATAARIEEHAAAHGLRSVNVVLHGGEPLLCGPAHLRTLLATFAGMSVRAHLTVQTNGLRLGPAFLDLFDEFRVRVGVSMDGGRAAHDRHRRTRAGRGSYDRVRAAVETLAAREGRFAGLLCTIDLRNDPVEVYEELISLRPPAVDFLLPHGNWSQPPPGRVPRGGTPYADWLIAVFDRWYGAVPPETSVRFLEGILVLHLGGRSGTEGIGPEPAAVVVVESDGSIEQSDALKSAYQGAAATGLHVATDPFDAVFGLPGVAVRRPPPSACLACPRVRVCGGGHVAHRYRDGAGFDRPSVYCPDLYRLIGHIGSRVTGDLARLGG
ncbi:FxsB family cyclophane-forming radical SAM/SPASM peptide maturase [Nonomuraea salmonea]|uniref:FxsB family cyclophane-forming radical SAM/SPASM peptide maturase n=1 Tax=Nonomuraea salmonea TaxID=46181 RepID=A0ABV5P4Z1_9ACTN